jgi:glycosyltransferase involved in cell wall biosynthesis
LKVLAISTSCFTASNREFYRRLQANGLNISLVIPDSWNFGKGWVKAEPKGLADPEISFLEASNSHQRLYYLKNITSVIDKFTPDAIYYEGDPGSLMAAILGVIANKKKIKLLALSCENLSQSPIAVVKREGIKQFFNACIKYSLIKLSAKKIHTLFVINKEGLAYFTTLGFNNVIQTPLGFNEQNFQIKKSWRESIRKKLNIAPDTVVIAYFGRLVYEKGVHLLIKALEELQSKDWVFLIDDFSRYKNDYQEKLEEQLKTSKIKSKTIFFEADHEEIAQYMNAADITVLPSIPTKKWVEQYGRVVPEAMACGNRLIISNVGAQTDFFESAYEFQCSPRNGKELIALLAKAINEIRGQNFNRNYYAAIAEKKFSLKAHLKVFKEAVNT